MELWAGSPAWRKLWVNQWSQTFLCKCCFIFLTLSLVNVCSTRKLIYACFEFHPAASDKKWLQIRNNMLLSEVQCSSSTHRWGEWCWSTPVMIHCVQAAHQVSLCSTTSNWHETIRCLFQNTRFPWIKSDWRIIGLDSRGVWLWDVLWILTHCVASHQQRKVRGFCSWH